MADFGNLLGGFDEEPELLHNNNNDTDEEEMDEVVEAATPPESHRSKSKSGTAGRPSLAGTEATEPMMSEDWESPATVAAPATPAEVPAVLQEAKRRLVEEQDLGDTSTATTSLDKETREFEELIKFGGTQEGQEQQQLEVNEVYAKLHDYWSQEKYSPELLEYDEDMVTNICQQIEARQEWMDRIVEEGAGGNRSMGEASVQNLLVSLAQVDLDRVKFVLANWLGTRLAKIEAHPLHMREKIDHMSEAELAYLKEYGMMLEDHLRRTVLDHIPEAWQALDEDHMIDKPNYDEYHFWMVRETIDAEGDQEPGTCLVAKYSDMREYMREGQVELQL